MPWEVVEVAGCNPEQKIPECAVLNKRMRLAVVLMGFSGLIAEIFLLRELLVVFSGNELSIGLILANWMIIEAAGCFFPGNLIDRTERKLEAFALLTVLFFLALGAAIYAIRILKPLLGVAIGEHFALLPMFSASFLVLLPVSLFHGALFTFSCRIYALYPQVQDKIAGKVYLDESLGTILGALACTFIFIPFFNSFEVVFGAAVLNFLACLWILRPVSPPPVKGPGQGLRLWFMPGLFILLSLTAVLALVFAQVDRLQHSSLRRQWQDHDLVHYQNSAYSNIAVLENQGQYLFFLDGILDLITPVPDRLAVEEFVHLPMLAHPRPREILIIGGGAGGMIDEVLKHPAVEKIHYAEHDPALLEVIRQFPTPLTEAELGDGRVQVKHRDGRFLLATNPHRYDLIFVGVAEAANLQANRYFTREFFSLARGRLREDGILVVAAPGSLSFFSDELQSLNSSLYRTLSAVFDHLRVAPGDQRNLFMASGSAGVRDLDMETLERRLTERGLVADTVPPWHIERKLHPGWDQWFLDYIEGASQRVNRDFNPVGLYYYLNHWNSIFAPGFGEFYRRLEGISPVRILLWVLPPYAVFLLLIGGRRRAQHLVLPAAIAGSGFAAMIFSLVIIFAFQVVYGNVFFWIGLLLACFICGAAAGALWINRCLSDNRKDRSYFLVLEMLLVLFALVLPLLLLLVQALLDSPFAFAVMRGLFLGLSLLAGVLVGMQFPLANRLQLTLSGHVSRTAGLLYASDLLGGWLGGIAGAVVLLPLIGLNGTCLLVAGIKTATWLSLKCHPLLR